MKSKGSSTEKGFGKNHTSFANMPQETVMRAYPKVGSGLNYDIDDTIVGVDAVMHQADHVIRKHKPKSRY